MKYNIIPALLVITFSSHVFSQSLLVRSPEELKSQSTNIDNEKIIVSNPGGIKYNDLSADEIDTAILRILTSLIQRSPDNARERLNFGEEGFVKLMEFLAPAGEYARDKQSQQMAVACELWLESSAPLDLRVSESLAVYDRQGIENGQSINDMYQRALVDIEEVLDSSELTIFASFLSLERRVMARANILSFSENIEKSEAKIETMNNYCGEPAQ